MLVLTVDPSAVDRRIVFLRGPQGALARAELHWAQPTPAPLDAQTPPPVRLLLARCAWLPEGYLQDLSIETRVGVPDQTCEEQLTLRAEMDGLPLRVVVSATRLYNPPRYERLRLLFEADEQINIARWNALVFKGLTVAQFAHGLTPPQLTARHAS